MNNERCLILNAVHLFRRRPGRSRAQGEPEAKLVLLMIVGLMDKESICSLHWPGSAGRQKAPK